MIGYCFIILVGYYIMQKSQIISEIEAKVESAKTVRYSLWTIGVTDDPLDRKSQHGDPKHWRQWTTDSEQDGRDIEEYFLNKGMNGGTGGGGTADYVYIF